ncbi:MAG: PilZ domain-containing protein [Candidatus Omnitrophota bacterium]|nr:PilZ domain-containing protein [Candidatus Omnitrophota bacterium]
MREKQSPKQSQKQPQQIIQEERRKYKRINKNFILTYYEKIKPKERYEVTQMKNISLGGMCFITTQAYPPSTLIAV